jgi:predicted ATPase/DNA-binding CsgD family transcriptional regulator
MNADRTVPSAEPPEQTTQSGFPTHRDQPRHNNLPLALSSFVGRMEALATVQHLLAKTRLLTLSGPGGVGKTRLALEAARALQEAFEDGVWWVDLSPLGEPGLVAQSVIEALALPDDPTRSEVALLRRYLRHKSLLLVLDNCEQVIGECAELAQQLLSRCARLRILATSREALGVAGEAVWSVPPLSIPCLDGIPTLESLTQSESGQLFLERARAVQPDLPTTEPVVSAMAQVCCRLDGIPLAIELAAARVHVLSVPEIAARLDDRFRLLRGGSRTAPPRHQTLKAAIDGSYDLLAEPERQLFRRLAVFVGGFTLEGAEAVAGDVAGPETVSAMSLVDLLSRLVTKSLVVVIAGQQTRYRMLETLRQYAWERLVAAGELEQMRRRHMAYYLQFAERAEQGLYGGDQVEWLKSLEIEYDNLRTALLWCAEVGSPEDGLRLAASLGGFWLRVGYLTEGSGWLERALAACQHTGPVRAWALYQAGRLAELRGDYEQALAFAKQSLTLSQELEDERAIARALGLMGWITHAQGDRDRARPLLEQGLAMARKTGDERTVARILIYLSDLRLRQAALDEVDPLLYESLALYEGMGDKWGMAWAHGTLGEVARLRRDYAQAVAHLQLSLVLYQDLDSRSEIPYPLEALALAAADQGQFEQAARLWGAASGLRSAVHARLQPSYEADYAPTLARARAALGQKAFASAWAEGRTMTLAQTLSLAMATEVASPEEPAPAEPRGHTYGLTPREIEVLRLVSTGLTDAQIAEKLVISPRTVAKHLQSIYSKLYLPSRSAATRWAIEHDLA